MKHWLDDARRSADLSAKVRARDIHDWIRLMLRVQRELQHGNGELVWTVLPELLAEARQLEEDASSTYHQLLGSVQLRRDPALGETARTARTLRKEAQTRVERLEAVVEAIASAYPKPPTDPAVESVPGAVELLAIAQVIVAIASVRQRLGQIPADSLSLSADDDLYRYLVMLVQLEDQLDRLPPDPSVDRVRTLVGMVYLLIDYIDGWIDDGDSRG